MNDETIFINYINDNYSGVCNTLRILCGQRQQSFDEDTFHESILRCHKAINKKVICWINHLMVLHHISSGVISI